MKNDTRFEEVWHKADKDSHGIIPVSDPLNAQGVAFGVNQNSDGGHFTHCVVNGHHHGFSYRIGFAAFEFNDLALTSYLFPASATRRAQDDQ